MTMNRRHMLETLTTAVAGFGILDRATADDQDKSRHGAADSPHTRSMQDCLDACTDCMNECNITAHYCYEEAGKGSAKFLHPLHMTVDCQEFCGQSAKLVGRASPLMFVACKACAEACEMCAEECDKHAADQQLARCAKECRDCAKSCRNMVEHAGHHAVSKDDKRQAR
jgi:hypothetical protein